MKISYIIGRDAITVFDGGKSHVIAKTHVSYDLLLAALRDNNEGEVRALLKSPKERIVNDTNGLVSIENGTLIFDGKPLHNALTVRIVALLRQGFDIKPMTNFLINLMENPSKRAVDELYGFLEACNLPITEDGHFIAYKMIQSDYTDIYTGTMDNSVGKIVKMPRNTVDEDKNRTCSDGLHFASLYYVESGGYGSRSSGHRLVAVKINPRDVVSIPADYNNSKGRACEYLILEELDWSDRLPSNVTGFSTSQDDYADPDDDGDDEGAWDEDQEYEEEYGEEEEDEADDHSVPTSPAPNIPAASSATLAPSANRLEDTKVYTVKHLLSLTPKKTLSEIETLTGVSRRQIARIRDGQSGTHVAYP